jgi:PHP family Zn ribbon phosphoesterase
VRRYSCDLHIHSTLSPCASLEMSPRNIVTRARQVGLDIVAITDHNMVENAFYAYELAGETAPLVLFGMELQTMEEIHLLVLFDVYETALGFQRTIYDLLPDVKNDPVYFGDQVVVDEKDEIVRFEERLLLNSAQISLGEAVSTAKSRKGLVIPSHIDSATFSIISQLGFVPDDLAFDALEVVNRERIDAILPFVGQNNFPFVSFSDAHYLNEIGRRRTALQLKEASLGEIGRALQELRNAPLQGTQSPPGS